ncbi:hypothetical protein [Peribacillus sp. NPDC097295]|uniref:hypothetical protein n=1 Tax=Peribacillus sp. NPDC097295 TaxID=3364402 RepID=UPI00380C0D75
MMKKKLFALIGGTLMSAMFLAGCGTNDDDNNPAPENDNMIEENQNGNDGNNLDTDNDGMIENDDTINEDENKTDGMIEDAERKGEDEMK